MKKTLAIVITLSVIIGLNFGVSYYTDSKYIDYSFFVGFAVTIIILFFTSNGGYTTRKLDMKIQGTTGIKMEQEKFNFSPNIAFMTSLIYTIFSLVLTLYIYRNYL